MSIPRTGLWNIQRPADLPRASAVHVADSGPLEITQSGTAGDDTLIGTDGNDSLNGLAGNDLIDGGAGVDILNGGLGNDIIHGGEDNDVLHALYPNNGHGEGSVDEIYGEGGDDHIGGSKGLDRLRGGFGDDDIRGLGGDDFLSGNDGADKLIGADGSDRMLGGDGNDILYGDGNSYDSGEGYDSLWGGAGDDTLDGGSTYYQRDFIDGGAGNDRMKGGGTLLGGDGDDVIEGGRLVEGGAGDDMIDVKSFADVKGGSGADHVRATRSTGNAFDQTLDGGTQPEGAADTLQLHWYSSGGFDSFSIVDCGRGIAQGLSEWSAVNFERAILTLRFAGTLTGGAFDDVFDVRDSAVLNGGGGDDRLSGGGVLNGEAGDDVIDGWGDDDLITGGRGADDLDGRTGADRFVYTSVKDSFRAASDFIWSLSSIDIIDLAAIDADATQAGDQAFVLVDALTGVAGQLTVHHEDGAKRSFILGDVDGDGRSDLCINVFRDVSGYANFVL